MKVEISISFIPIRKTKLLKNLELVHFIILC